MNRENETVTISGTSLGALAGTLSSTTDLKGSTVFNAFMLDTQGETVLTFSAPGIAAATYTVRVGAFPHTCAIEDSRFVTMEGGCKDTQTHRVWSLVSPTVMTWHEAIWDSASPAGNVVADAYDVSLTNDYGNPPGGWPDASYTNYCHDLVEGGYSDWRVPTANELSDVYALGAGSPSHFAIDVAQDLHSATSVSSNPVLERRINLSTGVTSDRDKSYTSATLCVRIGS